MYRSSSRSSGSSARLLLCGGMGGEEQRGGGRRRRAGEATCHNLPWPSSETGSPGWMARHGNLGIHAYALGCMWGCSMHHEGPPRQARNSACVFPRMGCQGLWHAPGELQLSNVRVELLDHLHEAGRQRRDARIAAYAWVLWGARFHARPCERRGPHASVERCPAATSALSASKYGGRCGLSFAPKIELVCAPSLQEPLLHLLNGELSHSHQGGLCSLHGAQTATDARSMRVRCRRRFAFVRDFRQDPQPDSRE
jgi:hypothetical protein